MEGIIMPHAEILGPDEQKIPKIVTNSVIKWSHVQQN